MTDINAKLKAASIPKQAIPIKRWGTSFNNSSGFSVKLTKTHWMAFFVDTRLMAGTFEERSKFLKKYKPIAHSVTEVGPGWNIFGEPIASGQLGITIYTAKGKAIAAGTAKMSKSTGDFSFSISTLYKGITNRGKIEYKVQGTGHSDGSWEVTGSVSYTK